MAATLINHKAQEWADQGVNFDTLNSGDTVNGKKFVHNGQGWTIETPDAAPAGAVPSPAAPVPPPAPGAVLGPQTSLGPLVANPDGSATHQPPAPGALLGPAPLQDGAPVAQAAPAPVAAAPAPAPAAAPVNTAYKDALLKLLGTDPNGASLNDPALKGQMDAFSNSQTRARERARADMAERASAEGGVGIDSGAFNSGLLGLQERQGEAEGAFGAGLVGQELQARRQQLMQAAALASGDLNAEEARALQSRIADIDAEIRRQGLKQQGDQFGGTLGLEREKLAGSLGLESRRLDQQGSQFDRSFGEGARQFDVESALKRLGIETQGSLGSRDIDLRDKLGSAGINADILRMLLQNDQFNKGEAGTNARYGAGLNQDAILRLLGSL